MRIFAFVLLFMAFCVAVPPSYGAPSEEAPLQLMPAPQQGGGQQQALPGQMQSLPQLQGQGQPVELIDIYGVVPTKAPVPYLYIGIGLLALLLLAGLLFWLKKRQKPTPEIQIPPWDRALQDLAEARSLQKKAHGLLYMEKASQILRRYIEQRFAIQSTKQTTSEFLRSLAGPRGKELKEHRADLQSCLEQADLAKFAHKSQGEESIKAVETAVTGFVQATRPTMAQQEGVK